MNLKQQLSKQPYWLVIFICGVFMLAGVYYFRLLGLVAGTVLTFAVIGNRRFSTVLSMAQFWVISLSGPFISCSAFCYSLISGHKLIGNLSIDALYHQSLISTPLERLLQFLHGNKTLWYADFFSRRTHESPTWLHLYEPLFSATAISSVWMSFLIPILVLFSGAKKFRNTDEKATVIGSVISLAFLIALPTLDWFFDSGIIISRGLGFGDISPFLLPPVFWGLYSGLVLLISRIFFNSNLKNEPELS